MQCGGKYTGLKTKPQSFPGSGTCSLCLGKLFDLSGLHSAKQYDVYLRFLTAYKREFMWLRLVQSLPLSDPW